MKFAKCLLVFLLCAASGWSQIITTVAGNGGTYSGDGGLATSAGLDMPRAVAVDSAGNLYIGSGPRVRKVAPSGIITTFAGTGSPVDSGDGGPAGSAGVAFVNGLAVDGAGNLYIAGGQRVRKVTPTGIISTVAGGSFGYSGDGGPATSAGFVEVAAVAVDSAGNLFIVDSSNHRVRKVNSNGTINTVAGTGSAGFSGDGGPAVNATLASPSGVAVDASGNLYIADQFNNRIRKVTPDGTISTVAGNGIPAPTVDGLQAASTSLLDPAGVATDAAGNVYIADTEDSRVRKIAPNGVITTVAGNGFSGYTGDGGPATSAQIGLPESVTLDAAGNLYLADNFNKRVRAVSAPGTSAVLQVSPTSLNFNSTGGVTPPAQALSVTSTGGVSTFTVAATTSTGGNWLSASPTSGSTPASVTVSVNPTGLAAGTYTGSLQIGGTTVPVTLNVVPSGIATVLNAFSGVGGGVAPNEIVSIFGGNLGPATAVQSTSLPLQRTLGGTQVLFDGNPAFLLFASSTQVNVLAPFALDGHSNTSIQVSYQGATAAGVTAAIVRTAPGLQTVDGKQVTAFHPDFSMVSPTHPAAIDEIITIYFTGGGQFNPAGVDDGQGSTSAMSLIQPVSVMIGGKLASVVYAGSAPGLPGYDQVNLRIPQGVPTGNAAVVLTAGSASSQSGVTIPVGASSTGVTTTTLTSSPNPSSYSQSITLTATVTPATATGTAVFKDGSTTLGSMSLSNGAAAFSISTLSAGAHSLTATYSGDANNAASTSAAVTQTVNQAATTTTLTSDPNPSTSGEDVFLTANVSPPRATGTVTFKEGAATLGSFNLASGANSIGYTQFSTGLHALTAVYSGDANYAPSASALLTQIVNAISAVAPCVVNFPSPTPIVCQFTAIASASFTVTTTASWLHVNPASGLLGPNPTSFSLSADPAGLAPGIYSGSFTISGPQLGSLSVPAQLSVTAGQSGTLVATPSSLSFTYQLGSPTPPSQTLTISSTNGTQLPFVVNASGGSWLLPGIPGGTAPLPFYVAVSPVNLAPGTYTGTLTISSPNVPSIAVKVTLNVIAPIPPQLSVNAPPINLSGSQGGAPASAQVQVTNSGGGRLDFTASASGGPWLSVSPPSGTVDNTSGDPSTLSVSLTVTADPTLLTPGTYQGVVTVTGAGSSSTIPVTFRVASPAPVILISQTGLSFTAAAQGGAPLPQQLGILNTGSSILNWTANPTTLSGGSWLQVSSSSGMVQQPYLDVSLVDVTIDPSVLATMTPGDYYGQIQITGLAANSPQVVTVVLSVLQTGTDPGPEVRPSSLIFVGPAGMSPAPQSVMIGIRKAVSDQYLSGYIGGGFTYSPMTAAVQPNQPASLQVTPDFTTLAPGEIDRGTIALQFSDGTAKTIALLTVVAPSQTAGSRLATRTVGPRAGTNCPNLTLAWRNPGPPNFTVVQGRGQTLELQVVDNCGNLIGPGNPQSASVLATFSNHDPDLNLVHIGNGIWTGTWTPGNPSVGTVTVNVSAFSALGQSLQSGQATVLSGTVLPGTTPVVTAVQHTASRVQGAPVAPGTLVTLQGSNLSDGDSASTGSPLPTLWNQTQVFLGTELLPLLYAGPGRVDVQVPYDVPVNTQLQVTVQRDFLQSLPQQLVIAPVQPGIFTVDGSGAGQGTIYRSDGVTLAQPGSAAMMGEMVTIQCTGLGAVSPGVQAGASPPLPAPTTVNPVSVTIGGLDGQASVGTLVAGQPGVYQVTAIVPYGVSGDTVPVVVTVAGQASQAVTMAVQ